MIEEVINKIYTHSNLIVQGKTFLTRSGKLLLETEDKSIFPLYSELGNEQKVATSHSGELMPIFKFMINPKSHEKFFNNKSDIENEGDERYFTENNVKNSPTPSVEEAEFERGNGEAEAQNQQNESDEIVSFSREELVQQAETQRILTAISVPKKCIQIDETVFSLSINGITNDFEIKYNLYEGRTRTHLYNCEKEFVKSLKYKQYQSKFNDRKSYLQQAHFCAETKNIQGIDIVTKKFKKIRNSQPNGPESAKKRIENDTVRQDLKQKAYVFKIIGVLAAAAASLLLLWNVSIWTIDTYNRIFNNPEIAETVKEQPIKKKQPETNKTVEETVPIIPEKKTLSQKQIVEILLETENNPFCLGLTDAEKKKIIDKIKRETSYEKARKIALKTVDLEDV